MNNDIVIVADPQVRPGSPTTHLSKLSEYLWQHKPGKVVHIGDHWDLPSISSYASELEKEGRRLIDDLSAGTVALRRIMGYVDERNKKGKKKPYTPELHFCVGNHEERLDRYIKSKPELIGVFDLQAGIEALGWQYHPFLKPLWINGVCFRHFMTNPFSGRPVGGSVDNKLNKFTHPFVQGHVQQFQFGRRQNLEGKPHFGVVAGSFYMHNEEYRGADNTEIRGFVHMKHFINRFGFDDYDVEFISLERLLAM